MPPYDIDPFGKLMQVERMIAEDQFKRQQYDDMINRQMEQDAMVAQDREMQQQAYGAIPEQISLQQQQFKDVGPQPYGATFEPNVQEATMDALLANSQNPQMLGVAGQYNKLLSPPAQGGGVTYKNAKRDDGTVGIFAIRPSGEVTDTGLDAEQKTSTGAMSQEEARGTALQIYKGLLDINTLPKRGTVRQSILKELRAIDPGFDVVAAEANAKYQKDAGNLKSVALIEGVQPLFDNLSKQALKLDNTTIPLWNKIKNTAAESTGDPDIVSFKNARDDFVAEAERILMGGGVLSDSKYNRALDNLNNSQSPEQMKVAIEQMQIVIDAREEALKGSPYQPGESVQPETAPQPTGGIKFLGFE